MIKDSILELKDHIDSELLSIKKKLNLFSNSIETIITNFSYYQNKNSVILREIKDILQKQRRPNDELNQSNMDIIDKGFYRKEISFDLPNDEESLMLSFQNGNDDMYDNEEKNRKKSDDFNEKNMNYLQKTEKLYVGRLDKNATLEELYILFGLKTTQYLRNNCSIELPLSARTNKPMGHAYITAPKNI